MYCVLDVRVLYIFWNCAWVLVCVCVSEQSNLVQMRAQKVQARKYVKDTGQSKRYIQYSQLSIFFYLFTWFFWLVNIDLFILNYLLNIKYSNNSVFYTTWMWSEDHFDHPVAWLFKWTPSSRCMKRFWKMHVPSCALYIHIYNIMYFPSIWLMSRFP